MANAPNYLDYDGLTLYDGLIKAEISGKIDIGGKAGQIPFGRVNSTSTSTKFTATVDGVTELVDGTTVMLHNGIVTSASGFTLDVNNLGAKPVYNNMATGNDITPTNPTRDTTIFNINYTMLFVYDSELVNGGAWICYRGYDANTNTIGYQLRTNSGNRPMSDAAYRYRLYFTSADGSKWVPANTSTSTDATTSRTLNTRAIDPFGPIVYNSTNGTTSRGARPAVTTLWQQYTLTIGYSYVKSLTAWDSIWLKCQPNTDGSAVMKDIVQALPSSKDGYIYILLGFAYSTTAMELRSEHPVYWHDGTGIRLWTGAESGGGSTVTVTQTLTSGTEIASVSVDGTATKLYAPTPPTVPSASSTTPSMDGTAAVGTATTYARADHVHPTDTSRQATLVSGTNIKTVNGNSLLGSGDIATPTYTLPTASTSTLGGVKVDGTSITIEDGVISSQSGSDTSCIELECVLQAYAWINKQQTIPSIFIKEDSHIIVAPTSDGGAAWDRYGVACISQEEGSITFSYSTSASITKTIPINVLVINQENKPTTYTITNNGGQSYGPDKYKATEGELVKINGMAMNRVSVYKTGDTSTAIITNALIPSNGSGITFTMPAYDVTVGPYTPPKDK